MFFPQSFDLYIIDLVTGMVLLVWLVFKQKNNSLFWMADSPACTLLSEYQPGLVVKQINFIFNWSQSKKSFHWYKHFPKNDQKRICLRGVRTFSFNRLSLWHQSRKTLTCPVFWRNTSQLSATMVGHNNLPLIIWHLMFSEVHHILILLLALVLYNGLLGHFVLNFVEWRSEKLKSHFSVLSMYEPQKCLIYWLNFPFFQTKKWPMILLERIFTWWSVNKKVNIINCLICFVYNCMWVKGNKFGFSRFNPRPLTFWSRLAIFIVGFGLLFGFFSLMVYVPLCLSFNLILFSLVLPVSLLNWFLVIKCWIRELKITYNRSGTSCFFITE